MPSKHPTSRRDFLRGRAVGSTAISTPCRWPGDSIAAPYLVRIGRRAMACEFQVFLNAGEYPQGNQAAIEALNLVDHLEAQMTVYRPESEISTINRLAADEPVDVEPRLFDLLATGIELWRNTAGAFDMTAGPLADLWTMARREARLPGDGELAETLANVGSQWLRLDERAGTLKFLKPGIKLNLGAIGKGHALDRAAAVLTHAGVDDFLFHGGQSSVLARGNGSAEVAGWSVGLVHPLRPAVRLGEIRMREGALSTSGSGTQFFTHRGRRYGHIVDPRTGRPASDLLSATVLASTAAEADALSTALFVMGPAAAAEWCDRNPDVSTILVWPGSKTGTIELRTWNCPDEVWRRLAD